MAPARPTEQTLCGRHAVWAALEARPDTLRRLFFESEHLPELRAVLARLARRRVPYREASADDLTKLSGSRAHQGLVAVFEAPPRLPTTPAVIREWAAQPGTWVVLDGVGNPHNLGAIARTAAFLGARGLWLDGSNAGSILSTAAFRTAEGALERLPAWHVADLPSAIQWFQQGGGTAVALAPDGVVSVGELRLPAKGARLLVAGAEDQGLRAEVRQVCRLAAKIEGGRVESLNVGVALGIALDRLRSR